MKSLKNIQYLFLALSILITSCSTDDDSSENLSGENNLTMEFDNSVNGDDLILNSAAYTNSNVERITINRFNYIVSNFVLIDSEGNKFTYPKDESYFVISEEVGLNEVQLTNIPAGEYVALRFGVGVDQEKYLQGAEGQGDFIQTAESTNMLWSWLTGYKFLNFEGSFTTATSTEAQDFKIHMGSHGSSLDNYKEFTVDLPTKALVSSNLSPIVHFKVDANQILDGQNKILLSEKSVVMIDEVKSPQIATNAATMFSVDHIHNGENHDH